ncbi:MAG: uroporphyrinogen-III synthase [Candidatus Krumholzibacteria bacterium]|nr:uroporphyrinogen-III synthase [Candidatus Krumholzibacteria bacterium]
MTEGHRIILTRQRDRNKIWAARLEAAGYAVVEAPLIRYESLPVDHDLDASAFDWILFTSPQGVKAFTAAGFVPGDARMGALGAGTADALKTAGLRDDLGARTLDGAEFAQAFLAKISGGGRVLLPGPDRRLPDPRASLSAAGFEVTELPLYKTCSVPAKELPTVEFAPGDIVFFCSPSTVRAFTEAWNERPRCVAIGETTARASRPAGFETVVAATPDLSAMVLAAGLDPLPEPATPEMES